jgi:hypothetical protein
LPTEERPLSPARGAILGAALLSLAAAAPVRCESPSFLPEAFARLEAARYVPADEDQVWTGWIGAGVDLVKAGRVSLEFTADVETIIGRERRAFDANQANYHLAGAARVALGRYEVAPFFHHASRHVVDRPKTQAVDWNIVGVRATAPLADGRGRVTAGVGHTIQVSLVGYGWEVTARGELDVLRRAPGEAYAALDLRYVTAEAVPEFPRGSFTDWGVEGGFRWRSGPRSLDTFAAFERRNDVFVEVPGARDRLLLGFRIGLAGRAR